MLKDINAKFNNAIADVVVEIENRRWKEVIEAVREIASMIKSSGFGERVFQAIMENLEIEIKKTLGIDMYLQYQRVMKNQDLYMKETLIIIPN